MKEKFKYSFPEKSQQLVCWWLLNQIAEKERTDEESQIKNCVYLFALTREN